MSGHSKWANIKNRKGAQDKKRSEAFTKAAKDIMTSIREGGGNTNLESNISLREAIEKARAVNMPKENIERLLQRFEERKNNLVGGIFEGFGPLGIPVMIEVETDNKNRILGEIKLVFRNFGGSLGESGSVSFMFNRVGEIELKSGLSEEDQLKLIDLGVRDIKGNLLITEVADLKRIVEKLKLMGQEIEQSALIYQCLNPVVLTDEAELDRVLEMIDILEDNDDIVNVFVGFDYVQKN